MYFKKWPFTLVAEEHPDIWAERHSLLSQMKSLFEDLERMDNSFVQIMWGYLGSGKTHTLKYFQYSLENKDGAIVEFTRFPVQARNFYELYRDGFVQSLNFPKFVKKCAEIWKGLLVEKGEEEAFAWILREIAHESYDFAQVVCNLAKLWSISPKEALRHHSFNLSRMWLQGAKLGMADMREIGLIKNIKNDEDAILALGGIMRLLTCEDKGNSLSNVWMLDDSQKLLERQAIQHGLRRAIDECPRRLLVLLSFAMTDPGKVRLGLIDELAKVCAPSLLELPPMNGDEACEYIVDIINHVDFKKEGTNKVYPYTEESISEIVAQMKAKRIDLLPRNLNWCASHLTKEAEKNSVDHITPKHVTDFFRDKCKPGCPILNE